MKEQTSNVCTFLCVRMKRISQLSHHRSFVSHRFFGKRTVDGVPGLSVPTERAGPKYSDDRTQMGDTETAARKRYDAWADRNVKDGMGDPDAPIANDRFAHMGKRPKDPNMPADLPKSEEEVESHPAAQNVRTVGYVTLLCLAWFIYRMVTDPYSDGEYYARYRVQPGGETRELYVKDRAREERKKLIADLSQQK